MTMTLVETIIRNLEGRKGFDAAFDIDDDVLAEIKQEMADAIDAHFTRTAQSLDVMAVREVIFALQGHVTPRWTRAKCADKLTAALQEADR